MKRFNFLCIIAVLAVSCFAVGQVSRAGEAEDLIGDPEKTIFFIFATGGIQGSFGTMETCVFCHGNGGKGTAEGRKMNVPDFTDANWQSSVTDEQMIAHLESNDKGCTKCRGRISEAAIKKLVKIVRNFGTGS